MQQPLPPSMMASTEISSNQRFYCYILKLFLTHFFEFLNSFIKRSYNFLILLLGHQLICGQNIVSNTKLKIMYDSCFIFDRIWTRFFSSPGHRPCELLSWLGIRRRRLSVSFSHLNLLLWNHRTDLNQTCQKCSLDGPLPDLCFWCWFEI